MDPSEFKCDFLSPDKIKDIADEFRKEYWPENTLPIEMEKIINRLQMDLIPEPGIKTDAYLQRDLTGIVVNFEQYMDERNSYVNRLRFSLAHEIGHYVLHKKLCLNFKFNTEDEYLLFQENIPEEEYQGFEWQANEFAGSLLVPRDRLKEEIDKIYVMIKQRNQLDYLEKYPDQILSRVSEKLCKPFGVSTMVAKIRAEREKLWPPK